MKTCSVCWSPINWCESFDRFGHGDGDDCVHTRDIARVLVNNGFTVHVDESGLHNSYITEIFDNELSWVFYADGVPKENRVGTTNPRDVLPSNVIKLLDETFGVGTFLG